MVLSDRDIRQHIESGKIRLTPAIDFETQLGSCSIDLKLGNVFSVFEHSKFPFIDLRNGVDMDQVMRQVKIRDDESFVLHPGQMVLGITRESMELPDDILARRGSSVAYEH